MRSNSFCSETGNLDVPYRFQRNATNINWNGISRPINVDNNYYNSKKLSLPDELVIFPTLSYVSQLSHSNISNKDKQFNRSKTSIEKHKCVNNNTDLSYKEYFILNKSLNKDSNFCDNSRNSQFTKVESILDKYKGNKILNNKNGSRIMDQSGSSRSSIINHNHDKIDCLTSVSSISITSASIPTRKPPLAPPFILSRDQNLILDHGNNNNNNNNNNNKVWKPNIHNCNDSNNRILGKLWNKNKLDNNEKVINNNNNNNNNDMNEDDEDDEDDDVDDDDDDEDGDEEDDDDETVENSTDIWTDDGVGTGFTGDNDEDDDELELEGASEALFGTENDSDFGDNRSDTQSPSLEMLEQVRMKVNAEYGEANRPKSPFIYSLFPNVPPVIRFVREGETIMPLPWKYRKQLKWRYGPITPNVVKRAAKRSGFRLKEKGGPSWMGFYGKSLKSSAYKTILEHQKINHLPGSFQIGRKDKLWRNMSLLAAKNGKMSDFKFLPKTYCLPSDLKVLERAWEDDEAKKKARWIIKPPASARGIGVKVVSRWNQIPKKTPVIVQAYLTKPFLINQSKFDLRVYVAVTSMDPLRVYVYQDGLVRFASHKYSKSSKNLNNKFIHLTNYSINKKNENYTSNEDHSKCQGHKWTLKSLWKHLEEDLNIDWRPIWIKIKDYVLKTIISVESKINSNIKMYCSHKGCVFELFGFDVILDNKLRPYVLEVNISPSLHSNSPLDIEVKSGLIADLFNLVGFQLFPSSTPNDPSTLNGGGILSPVAQQRRPSLSAPIYRARSSSTSSIPNSIKKQNSTKKISVSNTPNTNNTTVVIKKKLRKNSSTKSLMFKTVLEANKTEIESSKNNSNDSPSTNCNKPGPNGDDNCGKENEYPISSEDLIYQKRGYYLRPLTSNEKQKHKYFIRKGYYDDPEKANGILNQLTIDDVRILIESIDEFNRAGKFELVFPVNSAASQSSSSSSVPQPPPSSSSSSSTIATSINDNDYISYIANNSGCLYYNCLLREFIKKYSIPSTDTSQTIPKISETGLKLLRKYALRIPTNISDTLSDNIWSPPTQLSSKSANKILTNQNRLKTTISR